MLDKTANDPFSQTDEGEADSSTYQDIEMVKEGGVRLIVTYCHDKHDRDTALESLKSDWTKKVPTPCWAVITTKSFCSWIRKRIWK
ncbi:MAG: hypothetical protein ABI378_14310 [Chitinophagaceae bacterium]